METRTLAANKQPKLKTKFLRDLQEAIEKRKNDPNKILSLNDPERRMSEEQKASTAQLANRQINLPLLNENWEYHLFRSVVGIAEAELYVLLPPEVYAYLLTLTDGISEEEAREGAEIVTYYLVQRIKTPLGNWMEEQIIGTVMRLLMKALIKNENIDYNMFKKFYFAMKIGAMTKFC